MRAWRERVSAAAGRAGRQVVGSSANQPERSAPESSGRVVWWWRREEQEDEDRRRKIMEGVNVDIKSGEEEKSRRKGGG
ncbi:hypothetical protein E2C01_098603 [Portunus trituberculatus]|uniref:Uncharacterized protein n=1 Tax=Portunus trituberculatus TaxID=210409 RepID=A0A5B7KDB8_PORTR|nr:hypothetical protein [Portunus trituberculatus]